MVGTRANTAKGRARLVPGSSGSARSEHTEAAGSAPIWLGPGAAEQELLPGRGSVTRRREAPRGKGRAPLGLSAGAGGQ